MGKKSKWKNSKSLSLNLLVYLFHYKQMVWWGFSCVLHSNLKYNCQRVDLRDTWSRAMSSFSFCFALKPSNAMSSEGTALLGADPPEQCARRFLQGSGSQPCHRLILSSVWSCVELWGSVQAPGEYVLCRLLCNITLKLVQFIFTFPMN